MFSGTDAWTSVRLTWLEQHCWFHSIVLITLDGPVRTFAPEDQGSPPSIDRLRLVDKFPTGHF